MSLREKLVQYIFLGLSGLVTLLAGIAYILHLRLRKAQVAVLSEHIRVTNKEEDDKLSTLRSNLNEALKAYKKAK